MKAVTIQYKLQVLADQACREHGFPNGSVSTWKVEGDTLSLTVQYSDEQSIDAVTSIEERMVPTDRGSA